MDCAFVGDVFLGDDASPFFVGEALRGRLMAHEIRVCNLEAPVAAAGDLPSRKAGTLLGHGAQAVNDVKTVFNGIALANNHILDYGEAALRRTLRVLDGVPTVGAGAAREEAYRPLVLDAGGFKLGLVAVCEGQSGALMPGMAGRGGYAWMGAPEVMEHIATLRGEVDVLVVLAHAGVENVHLPLPELRSLYRSFLAAGADAVVGHHPHVAQGCEWVGERPIYYSLGNFCFRACDNDDQRFGYAVSLTVEPGGGKRWERIPTRQSDGVTDLATDPSAAEELTRRDAMLASDGYERDWNALAVQLWAERYKRYYTKGLAPSRFRELLRSLKAWALGRAPQPADVEALLLHDLRIESHRWCVQRALEVLTGERA